MARLFFLFGMLSLLTGLLLGCIAGVQFLYPWVFNTTMPFYKVRPLHVSFVVWWLFLMGAGSVYYCMASLSEGGVISINRDWHDSRWAQILAVLQLCLWIVSGVLIVFCFANGIFGGREYLEYPPVLSIPISLGWVCFAANIFRATGWFKADWPVFLWLWLTAMGFFIYAFAEAHLWLLPWFGSNIVREITVQWKSYGELVASWNMLIYGTAMCVMCLISGDLEVNRGKTAFTLYFIALANSCFNWGHHTYAVPANAWVREVAYGVSMLELAIFAKLIWTWRKNLDAGRRFRHLSSYHLIMAADVWIILNLTLALALSVPALNLYLHGTHAVVAHSMGATIGINSMIILAALYFVFSRRERECQQTIGRTFQVGYWMLNGALLVFWVALIIAGIYKGIFLQSDSFQSYTAVLWKIRPFLFAFVIAGITLALGLFALVLPLLPHFVFAWEERSAEVP